MTIAVVNCQMFRKGVGGQRGLSRRDPSYARERGLFSVPLFLCPLRRKGGHILGAFFGGGGCFGEFVCRQPLFEISEIANSVAIKAFSPKQGLVFAVNGASAPPPPPPNSLAVGPPPPLLLEDPPPPPWIFKQPPAPPPPRRKGGGGGGEGSGAGGGGRRRGPIYRENEPLFSAKTP